MERMTKVQRGVARLLRPTLLQKNIGPHWTASDKLETMT